MQTTNLPLNQDLAEVCRLLSEHKGPVRDPELLKRVRERGERIRDEIQKVHGVQDIAVEAIREARNSE